MKSQLLVFSMFLLVFCLPFRGNEEGVRWLWADSNWVPASLIFISLVFVGIYIYKVERTK